MPTLLVVDDEPNIIFTVEETLGSSDLKIISASTAREGIQAVGAHRPDAVLLDVRLPDMSGLDAFYRIHEIDSRIPVIIMTAFARTDTAIEAMRRGAFEYLVKPVDFAALRSAVNRAVDVGRLSHVPALLGDSPDSEESGVDRILGFSPRMQDVYKAIGRVAPLDATVLILGESGTGKELVARAIYHYSRRSQQPFLAVNCAALPESLLESELFGHEKGAFTGADQRRIGKFEQVSGGTIFLDEIGDMSPATQAKALRLLQQQQFERVGGNVTIQTDVRIIAATNRDLTMMVEDGRFRRDLYYRLNGFVIELPALRERIEDIPALTDHYIAVLSREMNRHIRSVTPEAREILASHSWPGNVRELISAVRYAIVHTTTDILTPDCLPSSCRRARNDHASDRAASTTQGDTSLPIIPGVCTDITKSNRQMSGDFDLLSVTRGLLRSSQDDLYRTIISSVDRHVLEETMRHCRNNQVHAAERLGISRMTLRTKLRATGLMQDKNAPSDPAE